MKEKVLVAMSGGVDSSVAAFLLKKDGFDVSGITMCFGITKDGEKPRCCGPEAMHDAKRVCHKLGIPHHVLNFSDDLKKHVIDDFICAYTKGKTPNPCIECNRHLKFQILLDKARAMGFDFLATGHYAKIRKIKQNFILEKPRDKKKDQTYFLYTIKKDMLKFIKFPLENLTKEKVRGIAKKAGIPVADKPQSQGICFIPDGNYRKFILEKTTAQPEGLILDVKGNVLGRHKGIFSYTIGQREGLGISYKKALYVISISLEKNEIVVGEKKDLKAKAFLAKKVNLLVDNMPKAASAKIRYEYKKEAKCNIAQEGEKLKTTFNRPQDAVTPGQSVVFYKDNTVLGGAIIEEVLHG